MSKRGLTKARIVLTEAKERVTVAEHEFQNAARGLEAQQAIYDRAALILNVHRDSYEALERSLAPKPRRSRANGGGKEKLSSTAPSVKKKSSRKNGQAALIPNTEAETESVLDADEKGERCWICGNNADFQDHFKPAPNFHDFILSNTKKSSAA